ncbi:MAG: patatin-like phospholipase family protein [Verrucomicrobia bacterium]|nr:patatin-like phospholipase family protein [Verrucomicrobiota bacterium]
MNYPFELQRREAAAIRARRRQAATPAASGNEGGAAPEYSTGSSTASAKGDPDRLPSRTVGLALSGGGMRAATFSLGILQALSKKGRLRQVDFISSVSCGGYTASFLGRLFTRNSIAKLSEEKGDPCERVASILAGKNSVQIQWLQQNAKHMGNAPGSAMGQDLAVKWCNLVAIYFTLGLLGLGLFGLLRLGGDWVTQIAGATGLAGLGSDGAFNLTPWWWLPLAVLGLAVLPCSIAFWLAPKKDTRGSFSFSPIAAWISSLALLGLALGLVSGTFGILTAIAILLLAAAWLELDRRRLPPNLDTSSGETSADPGSVIRNRLAFGIGESLRIFLICVLWATVDTLARGFARGEWEALLEAWALLVVLLALFFFGLGKFLPNVDAKKRNQRKQSTRFSSASFQAGIVAFPIAGLLVVLVDSAVHWLFNRQFALGFAAFLSGAILSVIFGSAFGFLNYSSNQNANGARISRVFLGASNPARISGAAGDEERALQLVHPDDDIPFCDYHPEANGGPLHLIGLCVNQTIDSVAQLSVSARKGFSMCVGPCGVSVDKKFHGIWAPRPFDKVPWSMRLRQFLDGANPSATNGKIALRAVPVAGENFHVFQGKTEWPVCVEPLTLGEWTAASAAGSGRSTSLSRSLLFGLANRRFGYWWNSGLNLSDRSISGSPIFWRKIQALPETLFKMQSLLISDFLGRFLGPAYRFWKISDGGRFDNTGIYELLRRRIPFIIAVDATDDASLDFNDVAELVGQVRTDFGAEVEFVDLAAVTSKVPAWISEWLADPERNVGKLRDIGKPDGAHATLARVTYDGDQEPATWIVMLKASVTGDEPFDVISYKKNSPDFPSESHPDQLLSEAQWECYRALGEHVGSMVLNRSS